MLMVIYMGLRSLKIFRPLSTGSTFASVIVACRDEQQNLPLLLNDIGTQLYPDNLFEVIIVDDNSEDSTFEIASGNSEIKNLTVIKNKGKGKKEAIRTGISISSGSLIITTDADCKMGENWLGTIIKYYENTNADMIVCPVKLGCGKGFFGRFQELEFLSLQGVTAGSILSGNSTMCNGANLAFKRDAYLINQVDLHPELLSGDDVFLLHSIKKRDHSRIEWLEAIESAVTTCSHNDAFRFLKQRRRWISKATAFNDSYTIVLGIVTFVTILLQIFTLAAGFFNHTYIYIYLLILILKSVPDFLIIRNTAARYGKSELMAWFLPSQVMYPFYVLITACYALFSPGQRN
jgi:cellulose synthase/poly-beta-1,6-N-acetylglucosamine synthase-like glycosyltransferase